MTVSRRVDHRLGAGSGRFSSSGSNMLGTIAIPNPEILPGMEILQVPAPVPLLPSPERKEITTTSRLHGHIRGPDSNPHSVVAAGDTEVAMNLGVIAGDAASSSSYGKRRERKDEDDDDNDRNNHSSSSSSRRNKQQIDSRSDHRLAPRGAAGTEESHRGEEKDHGEYTYANDQGNTFRAPRVNHSSSAVTTTLLSRASSNSHGQHNSRGNHSGMTGGMNASASHLSCYSGGHVDDDDDDEEVHTYTTTHIHTYIHTYITTHIHTYIHNNTHTYILHTK